METLWTNRTFWRRLAVVGLLVWNAAIGMASLLIPDFVWDTSPYYDSFKPGPAAVAAVVGSTIILALCLTVPWLAKSLDRAS